MKNKHKNSSKISIILILALLIVLGSLSLSGCSQSEPDTYRVGVLSGLEYFESYTDVFKSAMNELGYVEGENIEYDVQTTNFDIPTYQGILQQFVADEVDLIVVFPTEAAIEARNITEGTDIPVVFSFAVIEGGGVVDSIREPGGNITGVRYPGPEIALRRFEILRQIAPDATQFIVPYQKGYPIVEPQLEMLVPAAEAVGATIIEAPADNGEELASILSEISESLDMEKTAILMLAEPLAVTTEGFGALADFGAEHQIPLAGAFFPAEGYSSIFEVSANIAETGKQSALQADNVLKGTAAGTIPVISSDMTLLINNKQAEDLGLVVPEDLLRVADEILR